MAPHLTSLRLSSNGKITSFSLSLFFLPLHASERGRGRREGRKEGEEIRRQKGWKNCWPAEERGVIIEQLARDLTNTAARNSLLKLRVG